ncbi:MAG: metallophosphoesterase [Spirulina sp.]
MPLTLAQLSDTHLLAQPTDCLRGLNPWQSFQAVLAAALEYQLDGLLLTGDLAEEDSLEAYEHLRAATESLDLPIYWIPGNHDNPALLHQVFTDVPYHGPNQSLDLGHWRLILLDSVLPTAQFGEGHLSPDTLTWLEDTLAQHPAQPTAVALHHPPVSTGIDWLDQIQLQRADDFLTRLERFEQVKVVTFGHAHLEIDQRWGEVCYYGCPSTVHQVTPTQPSPNHDQPGFRLITLHPNGQHQTEVRRVALTVAVGG